MRLNVCPLLKRRFSVEETSNVRCGGYARNLFQDGPLANIACSLRYW